ncbi:outer membrane protein [Pseudaminobacter soli (ex Li et al. 2025)]|uniref:outer membrane protein n=1 Tax=Pseudaminobacter soli (ex Li et al. 2025) TaxID=1295366 RepID=UPI00247490CB|nr:porin family protein [Mesorhizobium soli]
MKNCIIASALLVASITGAKAADVVVQEPVAAYNWSGIYVGGQIGYVAGGKVNHAYDIAQYGEDSQWNYRLNPKGGFGGVFGGYNYQLDGGVVLGVEGDLVWGNVKADGANVSATSFMSNTKLDWIGTARARVGYAFDRFMPYIAGGLSVARFRFGEVNVDHSDFPSTGASTASGTMTGWTIGAGAEYAVTENWTVRGEYRYTQYGKKDFTATPESNSWEDPWTARVRTHDVRLGVAYKF